MSHSCAVCVRLRRMKLQDIQEQLHTLGLERSQQGAVLALIDSKVEGDMEKVLAKMDAFNLEIKRLEDKVDTKFGAVDHKISMLTWAIGLLIALLVALKFVH